MLGFLRLEPLMLMASCIIWTCGISQYIDLSTLGDVFGELNDSPASRPLPCLFRAGPANSTSSARSIFLGPYPLLNCRGWQLVLLVFCSRIRICDAIPVPLRGEHEWLRLRAEEENRRTPVSSTVTP